MIKQPAKASLGTFSIAFHCKYAETLIYHAGYAKEICWTLFFVGLRIEVDAPGVLAALRP